MAKGGSARRFYGNYEYVIKLKDFYDPDKYNVSIRRGDQDYYFKKAIGWSQVGNSQKTFRTVENAVCGTATPTVYLKDDSLFNYTLGFLNTKIAFNYLSALNPTMNLLTTDICNLPLFISAKDLDNVSDMVEKCICESKEEWDAFETSWDFVEHPLVKYSHDLWDANAIDANMKYYYGYLPAVNGPLELCYMLWQGECNYRFKKLKENEEELNRIFIDIYGLQDELNPEVADEAITVRKADLQRDIKSFISYLVGIVMGRYSLDVTGIAYAGGEWDITKYRSYQPDDDGIVPIYVGVGMEDGLTARITELVKLIYGEESFKENMDFIAEALGKANNESSIETLNRYLNDGFYADHLKTYQKRPIYWLFSSGKQKGFKCLIYMHRYNKDTLARINAKYYLPESTRQKIELEDTEERIKGAEGKEKIRLEKTRTKLVDRYNETIEYGQVLDHMANQYIDIDLDDGVKVNYAKFQGVELVSDSGVKIKKDLLVPLK